VAAARVAAWKGRSVTTVVRRSFAERALGLFTRVERGEVTTALLLTLNGFLLLAAYASIKPVREALILTLPKGAEIKIYLSAGMAAVFLLAVPAYGKVAARLPRNRLIIGVTAFFASHLLVFYGLGKGLGPSAPLALAFYLWIGVFNMMVVAQFWAFANDIYSDEAGRRLFPLLGLGASVGAVAGSGIANALIARVGTMGMLLIAVAFLLLSAAATELVHRRELEQAASVESRRVAASRVAEGRGDAFRAVFRHRYVTLIAVFSLLFTLVKTNGEYMLAKLVQDAARAGVLHGEISAAHVTRYVASFYAQFLFYVDGVSLVIQALVVSRLVKYLGVGVAFFVLPVVAFIDASLIFFLPLLSIVKYGKVLENATDYSVNNTVRAMLWLPTSRQLKYLAKQAVDTFFVRMGDVASAGVVFLGVHAFGWSVRTFAACNAVLVLGWMVLAWGILRERSRLIEGDRRSAYSSAGHSTAGGRRAGFPAK
jgi:AAA family ATP:ADP antiporter